MTSTAPETTRPAADDLRPAAATEPFPRCPCCGWGLAVTHGQGQCPRCRFVLCLGCDGEQSSPGDD